MIDVSPFLMYSETKFKLVTTIDIEFSHRPELYKSFTFGNFMYTLLKVSDFYNWGLWGNLQFLMDPTELDKI